jgi:hypothetical protein
MLQNGQLLVNRKRIELVAGANDVDTGIRQVNQAFAPDPTLGDSVGSVVSRVMVVPLPPFNAWAGVTISEPFVSNGTVHVTITAPNNVTVMAMMCNPHTIACPLSADFYGNPTPSVPLVLAVEEGLGVGSFFGGG